jgi:hypothetical protein
MAENIAPPTAEELKKILGIGSVPRDVTDTTAFTPYGVVRGNPSAISYIKELIEADTTEFYEVESGN